MVDLGADRGHVTVELDSGPYEMEFSYQPVGQPSYSDVPSLIGSFDSENDAELAGARMLAIGNWRSFTVQKRYARPRPAASQEPSQIASQNLESPDEIQVSTPPQDASSPSSTEGP